MIKADLVNKIAGKAGITKAAAEKALNGFLASVQETLAQKGKVTLTGFGSFMVEKRQARKGRNPRTGAAINIPASWVVKFRPGKNLKSSVK